MSNQIIIKPRNKISIFKDLRELWQYKELLYFFTWKDIKVRYKQTVIGIGWAVFQPFVTMIIFSIFFGTFAKIPSDGIPYPVFVYTGLLIWQFFSSALSTTSNSLVGNQGILTKVYFPRLILPISSTITHFVDFIIASTILAGLMAYYGFAPNLFGLLMLPLLLIITFMLAVGGGLFLASVNVKYRDVRYALPFFIQTLMFITPVIYPPSLLEKYSWLMAINPMTGVIKAARAALFGNMPINWLLLSLSAIIGILLLVIGVLFFKKIEREFADIV